MKMFLLCKNIPALGLALILFLTSCTLDTPGVQESQTVPGISTDQPESSSAPTSQQGGETPSADEIEKIVIFYTNDEHGWISGGDDNLGAAGLAGAWEKQGSPTLVLSGGDNWTGPAISTWFQGESTAEVMNAMDYAAAALGNHEFDFGLDVLRQRIEQANFPYLAANVRRTSTGEIPTDLGIQPYTIVERGGIQIGVIGLAYQETPKVTNPNTVAEFEFLPYADVLETLVPEVRAAGAEIVVVPAHICESDLVELANAVQHLEISMMGGGHCHELFARQVGDIVLLGGGQSFASYAYAEMSVDPATGQVMDIEYGTQGNTSGTLSEEVSTIVARWEDEAAAELNVTIGYLGAEIDRYSQEMKSLITETWLAAFPNADVALTNLGGVRDNLPAGEISLADITSVMPFENTLVLMRLRGSDLLNLLRSSGDELAIGGVHQDGLDWVLNRSGEAVERDQTYGVLVNNFMYAGGGGFEQLPAMDPEGYDTSVNWRQPLIDWIMAQESSPQAPLDEAIRDLGK